MLQNSVEDQRRGVASEWQRARAHLVQHSTEREQVCPTVELLTLHLLRRHISDRPERRTGAGQMLFGNLHGRTGCRCCGLRLWNDLCQTEIQNLFEPPGGEGFRKARITGLFAPMCRWRTVLVDG